MTVEPAVTLSERDRTIATVAALLALGRRIEAVQLGIAALRGGLSRRQLVEVAWTVTGYGGYAAGGRSFLNDVFSRVPELDPVEQIDSRGPALGDLPQDDDRRAEAVRRVIFGPAAGMPRASFPEMEELGRWTTQRAFADIWARPGLSLWERNRAVRAVLMARQATEELRNHTFGAVRMGIPRAEILEEIAHLAQFCGSEAAEAAKAVARDVFARRNRAQKPAAT